MKVITIATLKGGNANTTTSLAVAPVLADKGHAVAVIDADVQSTATMTLGGGVVVEWAHERGSPPPSPADRGTDGRAEE